jgi:hypothetical protein
MGTTVGLVSWYIFASTAATGIDNNMIVAIAIVRILIVFPCIRFTPFSFGYFHHRAPPRRSLDLSSANERGKNWNRQEEPERPLLIPRATLTLGLLT